MDAAQLSVFDSVVIIVLTVVLFGLIIGVSRMWSALPVQRPPGDPAGPRYAGLASADGVQAEANLMVRELDQAGGFQRAVLGVGTTTGTGSLKKSATALEYLANGNSALVSVQYSYLPSPLSFLSDHTRAERAGKALFNAVYDKWKTLPPTYRPKLVVFGESLGSFGSESAFSGPSDMQARTDGVVFTGPPSMNEVWSELESARDPGSPQWLPVYQQGRVGALHGPGR